MIQFIAMVWISLFSIGISVPQEVNDNAQVDKVNQLSKDDGHGNGQGGGGGK